MSAWSSLKIAYEIDTQVHERTLKPTRDEWTLTLLWWGDSQFNEVEPRYDHQSYLKPGTPPWLDYSASEVK